MDSGEITDAKFEFTKVECLLFAFHTIARQDQKFVTENPEVFKEFKVLYSKTSLPSPQKWNRTSQQIYKLIVFVLKLKKIYDFWRFEKLMLQLHNNKNESETLS